MQSITFTPIELLQTGGWTVLCLGVTMLILSFGLFALKNSSLPSMYFGRIGFALMVVSCISFPVRYTMEGCIAHNAAFAELPVEWQAFCKGLDGLDSNFHSTAISRFVRTEQPPKLTLEHYAVITGAKLWPYAGIVTQAMRNLRCSSDLKAMVDFSFAEGKE